ncbi:hypothetical protein AAGG74_17955 [Bacillus mexicanus]|uniref:hypothetical protein n=1 Tax=Bacillus mexicanus TaxID=2834415 RepID=UPI003D1EA065
MKEKSTKFLKATISSFHLIEWAIVLLILATILFTFKEIATLILNEISEGTLLTHYKILLSDILLLAVGVEIAILIIKKDIYFVIDILILAIARKLITYENSIDILISVLCIFILIIGKWFKKKYNLKS